MKWSGIFCYLVIGYILGRKFENKNLNILVIVILSSAIIPVLFAFWQLLSGTYYFETLDIGRVQGTFIHPGGFGIFCSLMLTLAVPGYIFSKNRSFWIIVNLLLLTALVGSFFRTAWIGFLISIFSILFLTKRKETKYFLFFIMLIIILLFSDEIITRISDPRSWRWRVGVWNYLFSHSDTLSKIILGGGWGTAAEIAQTIPYSNVTTAHSTYLELFLDIGLFGIAIFLTFHYMMFKYSRRLFYSFNKMHKQFGLSGIILTSSLLVMYLSQTITNPVIQIYFWLIVGINSSIYMSRYRRL